MLALKGRPVAGKDEEDRINNKMVRIMTGEISEEYIKEKQIEGIQKVNNTK